MFNTVFLKCKCHLKISKKFLRHIDIYKTVPTIVLHVFIGVWKKFQ